METQVPQLAADGVEVYKKESYYIKLQYKVMKLRKDMEIYLGHAPKHEKFALCLRIRNRLDDVYELLIECRKRYWNKTTLTKLDVAHEVLRGDLRLYYELGYFEYHNSKLPTEEEELRAEDRALRRFKNANFQLNEIGRMIGGLVQASRKSQQSTADLAESSI